MSIGIIITTKTNINTKYVMVTGEEKVKENNHQLIMDGCHEIKYAVL